MPGLNLALDPSLKPPTDLEAKLLRQIVLAGMPDQVNVSFGDITCSKNDDSMNAKIKSQKLYIKLFCYHQFLTTKSSTAEKITLN